MGLFLILLSTFISQPAIHSVDALACLACSFVTQPRHCDTAMTCPQLNDVCYLERRTNSFGEEGYALGCILNHSCKNVSSVNHTSDCAQCYDKDLCNSGGCGEPGFPEDRGHAGFDCPFPLPEGRCHNIDICREGEVCSVTGKDNFGTTVFKSRCTPKDECGVHQVGVLIGKKRYTSDHHDCFQCCETDICNNKCKMQADRQWGSWTAWSLCFSHCNQTRSRSCDNPSSLQGGQDCFGLAMQTQGCYTDQCQIADCSDLLRLNATLPSGVYRITTPLTHSKLQVYCDMETDGGGWTVFQKRFNGSVDFYRNFSEYENGFGFVDGEHWLGLKYLHEMASLGSYQFRLYIVRYNGSKGFDVYDNFSLGPGTNYSFHIGSRLRFSGCESLINYESPDGKSFTTYDHDRDNDISNVNCAERFHGAWWYNSCFRFNANGLYAPGKTNITNMAYTDYVGLNATTLMFKRI